MGDESGAQIVVKNGIQNPNRNGVIGSVSAVGNGDNEDILTES